ncbi:hypothetical protein QJS10_CPA05g01998 [Acorus calamus]|uniref:Thiamine-repressible mitochondrial transport protein THI74 n=1 Tax=Acorus calamus TaxID=4465 RepID=A0AAV9ETV0_ACOCL|nr:hypothetical protein QJS10_CPA05g01998 [Acorus calamus]
MDSPTWRWALGLTYILAVAVIWIGASYIVQTVVDEGISPFIITYICNSLFVIYIPIVEVARYFEDSFDNLWFWKPRKSNHDLQLVTEPESDVLLQMSDNNTVVDQEGTGLDGDSKFSGHHKTETTLVDEDDTPTKSGILMVGSDNSQQLDSKGRWTRTRVAKASLWVCPFWFFAQLTFNLSLKYTTVTSNTILSTASSLFTFLVSIACLGEMFTWVKLFSVLLCMGGTVIVSLGDSATGSQNSVASSPLLGDILALISSALYAVYITLIRVKLPDEKNGEGRASMAQFLGFLGLFNLLIFFPVALVLNFTKLVSFYKLNWDQIGLIVGKGLLDNVFSDYLWAKAVLLTTTTVATAGLAIQVPLAAIVDGIKGHAPNMMDYIGAAAVLVGFIGINVPSEICSHNPVDVLTDHEEAEEVETLGAEHRLPISRDNTSV